MSAAPGPRRLDLRGVPPDRVDLDAVVEHLRRGGLVTYPTETVYGFGGPADVEGTARLAALKGSVGRVAFLLLVTGPEMVPELRWTEEARDLVRVFWPGSVTLLLKDTERRFPPGVRSASGSVGVRSTPHPLASRLVKAFGQPLTSTSANAPGRAPAVEGSEALEAARTLAAGEGMWVLDAGTLPPSAPSTIVDCTGTVPRVVRTGATPVERLRCLLPEIVEADD